ncbi:MAG TPA: tetratricopeptide repeat protein [Gammaproteobacteria bacterium]|nr:tetratricopeptide repeat protein [Gammaproteobacteria bacterium]
MTAIDNFERMLSAGRDSALLRFSLGSEYLKADAPDCAAEHLSRAVELDPDYSAAWKLYGKALVAAGREADAAEAYARGIAVATGRGDKQAAKEMQVFLRRLNKR